MLPRVIVLSTGGTIAGTSPSSTDTTHYKAGQRSGNELVQAVPEIAPVADITVEQIVNVSSPNMTQDLLLEISRAASRHLADDTVSGVVITHGTSTMEESALFMELTVSSDKPVVFVGSMRPGTAISADGPFNLLQAVALAASKDARGRGTMMVLNDRIGSALYTTKTNTLSLDTFKAYEQGYLGVFLGIKPVFFYTPATVPGMPKFDISRMGALPRIAIVYSHLDEDPTLLDYMIEGGAKGIVVAGTGNSSISKPLEEKIARIMQAGIPVVRASHVGAGFVSEKNEGIGSGFYNPQKARILLSLAVAAGASEETIRRYFIP